MWTWGAYAGGSEARVTPSEAGRSPLDRLQRQGAGFCTFISERESSSEIRITFRESLLESRVVPVDVVVEVNDAVFQHDHGAIEDQDRDRMR